MIPPKLITASFEVHGLWSCGFAEEKEKAAVKDRRFCRLLKMKR
jgi:hypothetical protein